MNFVIGTSSTADLSPQVFSERNIFYIPFTYMIEEKEYVDDLGKTMSHEEFYRKIQEEGVLPTTSQINVQKYIDTFRPWLQEGKDIIYVELSSGITGSVQSLMMAKKMLEEEFPERRMYFHDSFGASSGLGLLMTYIADLRDEGKTAKEIDAWIEENKLHIHHWFYTTDLTHYRRGGRVSATSAWVGGLLNICPLLHMDRPGRLIPMEKVRGKKKVMMETLKKMEEFATDRLEYNGKCFISHSARLEEAQELANMIEKTFPNLKGPVQIYSVGAVIGAHTGPGTIALFFHGDER